MKNKKIGIFDSGFGGLTILKGIRKMMPEYDYIYLGDTARAPYGSRSDDQIFQFTCEAIDFLFSKNCDLVVLACNTASAQALRKIQQRYLPKKYKGKNVLGVVVPTLEEIANDPESKNVLVIATEATVRSKSYPRELATMNNKINLYQKACPLLVPMIESGEQSKPFAKEIIKDYLSGLKKNKIDHLVLGCTHYGLIEKQIRAEVDLSLKITNQAKVVPQKLKEYLDDHQEYREWLSKKSLAVIYTTDITGNFKRFSEKLFPEVEVRSVNL